MKYLIDSDWLIDARIGIPAAVQAIEDLSERGLAVSIVSHGELFEGAFAFTDPGEQLAEIRAFLRPFRTVPLSDPVMELFGRTRSELRRSGQRIQDFDLLIGATAVHYDLILLTRNVKHFTRIPNLQLYGSV